MLKHLLSFVRSPIGYILNALVTVLVYAESMPGLKSVSAWAGDKLANPCDAVCLRDGVQDSPLF